MKASTRIGGGKTKSGEGWKKGDGEFIHIHVDTSAAGFTSTPVYLCSLSGTEYHCYTVGGNSVYGPNAHGFDVYLAWSKGTKMNGWNLESYSSTRQWRINWVGLQPA